jgi:hypothetical protein
MSRYRKDSIYFCRRGSNTPDVNIVTQEGLSLFNATANSVKYTNPGDVNEP